MLNRLLKRGSTAIARSIRAFASVPQKTAASEIANAGSSQFSRGKLTDFGELAFGEIPEALKYDRPFKLTTLGNGVRVATENTGSPLATIAVYVKTGSRFETLENSGVNHFISRLSLRGTNNRSRTQLDTDLANIGAQICVDFNREVTRFKIVVPKEKQSEAMGILGDVVLNGQFDKNQIEAEREGIYQNIINQQQDQHETTLENVHATMFRDHMFGQPRLGIRENVANITQEQIKQYHQTHYLGSNLVVVGTGSVAHDSLVQLAEETLGKASGNLPAGLQAPNTEKPYFTPSLMFVRDDEMVNANIGVFFEVPTWTDADFYAFQLFQRVLGDYRADRDTGNHLNSSDRQYNELHTALGMLPDITLHKASYLPYSDTAIFGNYFHGNEVHAFQMLYLSQTILSEYAYILNSVEVFRARNKAWLDLLNEDCGCCLNQRIGNQLLYLNRRVPRSEEASRISALTPGHLQRVANRWFFDRDIGIVAWGAIHSLSSSALYNRTIRRSTLGWYGTSPMLV